MTKDELREAMDVAEKLVKYLQEVLQRSKEGNKHNPELYLCLELQRETLKQIQSLQNLLSLARRVLELDGELEKIIEQTRWSRMVEVINNKKSISVQEFTADLSRALRERIWEEQ